MVTDFGAHLYPEAVVPDEIQQGPLGDIIGSLLSDPDELLSLYASAGIDRAVLSQPFYMGFGESDRVREANDALLEVIESNERLYGLAAIPTTAGGDAASSEFERALDAGYHGGALETSTDGVELVDSTLEPVLEVADRTDAPILVHPKLHDSLHPEALDDEYRLNAIFGREAALAASICKVIHDGVLDRYPDLDLVYHHVGGNIAAMIGRVHLQLDEGRWPGQEGLKSWPEFRAQFEDRIYLDSAGFFGYESPIRTALETVPAENLLFASDYPFEPRNDEELASFAEAIRTVTTGGETEELVLDSTAMSLLGG